MSKNLTTCVSDELAKKVEEAAKEDLRSVSKWLELVIIEKLGGK